MQLGGGFQFGGAQVLLTYSVSLRLDVMLWNVVVLSVFCKARSFGVNFLYHIPDRPR